MSTGGNPISLSYARQLVKNYKENDLAKGKILNDDTQAVWFSAETLLEALGISASAKPEITGLRFYFGAYGSVEGYPKDPAAYGKLTLVVVQTGTETITETVNGDDETIYLDIIDDPTAAPAYPDVNKNVPGKSTYNDGQYYPPPSDRGLGL